MKLRLGIILVTLLVLPPVALAKRAAPKAVLPIVSGGVKYIAPDVMPNYRAIYGNSTCPIQSTCVEARNHKTGKLLWQVKVYQTQIDPNLEQDVQSVYINSLAIDRGKLTIENERGDRYTVDLKTHLLKQL
jgi:outer membrane cobalamin receptor